MALQRFDMCASRSKILRGSYVLPIAAEVPQLRALSGYLHRLSRTIAEVIVVDGSPGEVFKAHKQAWSGFVHHLRPQQYTTNGKVGGVLTGVRAASHERVIIADDDVRYRTAELQRVLGLLRSFDIVRPQNTFHPLPWHARWDTARSLLNRLGDGDWPGTLGLRKSSLLGAGGYCGEVLFENLELVRTIEAAGGLSATPLDLFVERRPPTARHFLSQRVRQAYDEWARPKRLLTQLTLLPAAFALARSGRLRLAGAAIVAIVAAEAGRRRGGGRAAFPASSSLWAPAWLAERAITAWLAVGSRLICGGVRYRNGRLRHAATPRGKLERTWRARAEHREGHGTED